MNLYPLFRKVLFQMDAEKAHHLTLMLLKKTSPVLPLLSQAMDSPTLPLYQSVEAFGLPFPNAVGLAAGLDKNAECIDELHALGFGFIEIGTVTPKPQPGNPKPRLFRIPGDEALLNRMGFNNVGADVVASRLSKRKTGIIAGGNIGKNKDTPNEQAYLDYLYCFNRLFDQVDYFVVNVSSPNTSGLRALQEADSLRKILGSLQEVNQGKSKPKPLLLKIAPELDSGQLQDVAKIATEVGLSGIIATNTTLDRNLHSISAQQIEALGAGGLSGKPLQKKAGDVLKMLRQELNRLPDGERIELIASGGIMTAQDAVERIQSGAKLVQLYSGFVYRGPQLIREILLKFRSLT